MRDKPSKISMKTRRGGIWHIEIENEVYFRKFRRQGTLTPEEHAISLLMEGGRK